MLCMLLCRFAGIVLGGDWGNRGRRNEGEIYCLANTLRNGTLMWKAIRGRDVVGDGRVGLVLVVWT